MKVCSHLVQQTNSKLLFVLHSSSPTQKNNGIKPITSKCQTTRLTPHPVRFEYHSGECLVITMVGDNILLFLRFLLFYLLLLLLLNYDVD